MGYLVTYVVCDRGSRRHPSVGSNDQGRIYFNGVDIYAFTEARPLVLDADRAGHLEAGVNVFVFKIIKRPEQLAGALRMTDRSGQLLKGV